MNVGPWKEPLISQAWTTKALKVMDIVTLKPRSLADGMEDRGRMGRPSPGSRTRRWHCARCDWEGPEWRLAGHWLKKHYHESVDLFLKGKD